MYLLYSKVLATCQLKRNEAKKKYLGQIDDMYAEGQPPTFPGSRMVMAAGAGAGAGAGGKQVRGETTSGRRRAMMRRQASLTGDGERRTTRAQDNLTLAGRVQSSRLVLVGGGGALSVRVRPRLKNVTPSRILTRAPQPLTRDPYFPTKDFTTNPDVRISVGSPPLS